MAAALPVASYLFVLRKHKWLVLGVILVVLASGWVYVDRQVPEFRAAAKLQIKATGNADLDPTLLALRDRGFVADQMHRLRTDPILAEKALARLRGEAPPVQRHPDAPAPPAPPPPESFDGWTPSRLVGRVRLTSISGTSYHQLAVEGTERDQLYALANAYAEVFQDVFREETRRLVAGAEEERERRLEENRGHLADLIDDLAAFRKEHPDIDFDQATNPAKDRAELLRSTLMEENRSKLRLDQELRSLEQALEAAGLRFVADEAVGVHLATRGNDLDLAEEVLSPRVQALDLVRAYSGVSKARESIERLEEEERRLIREEGLREDARPVVRVRERMQEEEEAQAEATEAVLLGFWRRVRDAGAYVEETEKELRSLDQQVREVANALADFERLHGRIDDLKAEIAADEELLLQAERRRERVDDVAGGGTVRVYQYAPAGAASLVRPNRRSMYLVTGVMAILIAAALAYVLEYFDDTVKSREDFDRLVRLPFLGYVPHVAGGDKQERDLTVARGRTGSAEVESFRAIRTGIQFSRPDREVRTLVVTSAGPGEGKTTVSVNLATAFTGGKGRVLLIDADLRRARVHHALEVDNRRGLTNVLVSDVPLEDAVQRSVVPDLDVLASGPTPPNPADILGSEKMHRLIEEAAGKYDRVLIDSPPIVAVTDPSLLAKYVDGVFLVVSVGKTSIRTVLRAKETMASVGADIHGAILNNADVRAAGYAKYYGGYGYGYGDAADGQSTGLTSREKSTAV